MKIALRGIVGKGIILNILLCYQIGQISDCSQAGQGQERYQISKRGLMPGSLRRVQHLGQSCGPGWASGDPGLTEPSELCLLWF